VSAPAPPAGSGPVLVVGASLAGATVAVTLREAGFAGEVMLLGAENALPYERPALSKQYLTGRVSVEALLVQPASYYSDNRITLRLGESAVSLDPGRRLVRLTCGEQLPYGTLIIATGASNVRPPIPGIDLQGVHQLRTLADADDLLSAVTGARTAVTVGMGFIGCEVTATLTDLGLVVTAVDGGPGPLWGPLGPELSAVARGWHEQHGVRVLTGQGVTAFLPDATGSAVAAVEVAGGERLPADLVVVGVGARPNTGWLSGAPLDLLAGAIDVDTDGRTNLPGVYAVGDVTITRDQRTGTHRRHEHWASAIAQGRRTARLIAGLPPERPEPAYFWSDQYDKTLQYSGAHDADSHLVVRGDLSRPDEPVTAFFLRNGTVTAVLAVNDGKQFRRAQRLLGLSPNPTDLTDPAVDLRPLAQPAPVPAG
jgi:3-phenylpropionate/trans-cinnamate dioxygenase ferredoxin reductase subunit